MDKAVKISIMAGALIVALSVAYYLVVFLPRKETMRIEQQKKEQEAGDRQEKEKIKRENEAKLENKAKLDECLEKAREDYLERWKKQCASDREKIGTDGMCLLDDSSADFVRKTRTEDRDICFKKYPQ